MITPAGRQRMVDDLDTARELFRQADVITETVLFGVAGAHGISEDAVHTQAALRRAEVLAIAESGSTG